MLDLDMKIGVNFLELDLDGALNVQRFCRFLLFRANTLNFESSVEVLVVLRSLYSV